MGERNNLWPLSYRSELLQEVMAILRTSECCSLIGTSGMGKSNLARFLQRLDVQQHYWGDEFVLYVLQTFELNLHSIVTSEPALPMK